MDEENKQTAESAEKAKKQRPKKLLNPAEQLKISSKGKLKLETPIQDGDKTVDTVEWDFLALSGAEYCDALDRDMNATNAFRITNKQAFSLFAAAAAKKTDGLDQIDIITRMGIQDAQKGVQAATLFFFASSQMGNLRFLNA